MKPLMKTMFVAVLAGILCTAAAKPATAQSSGKVHVSIPFSFSAGKATLAAGDYTVQVLESGLVIFTNNVGRGSQLALSRSGYSFKASGSPHLVFTRYGDDAFLNQIFLSGDGAYAEVPPSGREQRLRQLAGEQISLFIAPSH